MDFRIKINCVKLKPRAVKRNSGIPQNGVYRGNTIAYRLFNSFYANNSGATSSSENPGI